MQKTIDPISILKEHIEQNKKIERQGQNLIFSEGVKLRLDTPTAFIQSQTDKKQYSLGSLWFYLKHRDAALSVYKTELQKEKIDGVLGIDKDQIIDFFINSNSDVKIIDESIRPKTLIFLGKKKPGENLEKLMQEEFNLKEKTPTDTLTSQMLEINKEKIPRLKKPRLEDLDPNLRIMDYIYTREKHSLNRNSILRPMPNLTSFENLFSICIRTFTKYKKINTSQSETLSFLDELISGEDLRGNKAIIIVPATFTPGNIFIDNAKQFLVDAIYINPNDQNQNSLGLHAGRSKYSFTKKIKDKELNFEIHSNIRNFSKSDWKRVVAVFVQGSDWEFADWPKSESITSILQKVKGFHLKFSDLPTNDNVKKWNVKVFEVSRTKRHFDVSLQNEFWNILEEFLRQPRYREKVINK